MFSIFCYKKIRLSDGRTHGRTDGCSNATTDGRTDTPSYAWESLRRESRYLSDAANEARKSKVTYCRNSHRISGEIANLLSIQRVSDISNSNSNVNNDMHFWAFLSSYFRRDCKSAIYLTRVWCQRLDSSGIKKMDRINNGKKNVFSTLWFFSKGSIWIEIGQAVYIMERFSILHIWKLFMLHLSLRW